MKKIIKKIKDVTLGVLFSAAALLLLIIFVISEMLDERGNDDEK